MDFKTDAQKKLAEDIMELFYDMQRQHGGRVGIEIKAIIESIHGSITTEADGDSHHAAVVKSMVAKLVHSGALSMVVEPRGAVMIYYNCGIESADDNSDHLWDLIHTSCRVKNLEDSLTSLREYVHSKLMS